MWSEKGQTLLELVVVIAVIFLVVSALVFAAISSLRNAQFSKNQAQATKLAQEGIERVRTGRDRNQVITNIPTNTAPVNSWNGDDDGSGAIWGYAIYDGCGSGVDDIACYFNVNSSGALNYIASSTTFPEDFAETIDVFKRVVTLSDSSGQCMTSSGNVPCYTVEKEVTVIVQWTDFSGTHESKLSTVLRRIE